MRVAFPAVDHLRTRNESANAFESMLPAIRRAASYAFRRLTSLRREEFVAAAIARAYEMYARLVDQGRAALAYATVLANYAIKQVREGRQVGARQNVRDVLSPFAQRQKSFSVMSLSTEILADTRKADPAELAALRIDFGSWLSGLCRFKRRLALFLAVGNSTNEASRRFNISPARVSQIRRELRAAWDAFQSVPAAAYAVH